MFKLVAALLLSLVASFSYATGSTANVAWTAPITYTDGHALPAAEIASYTINWSPQSPYATLGSVTAASTALSATVSSLTCGKYNFTVTVMTTATAYSPNSSATSAIVVYDTGIACVPPKPGSFTLTVT